MTDELSRKIAASLEALVLLSGRTRRSLEQELGLGSAGLSKILNGTVRLQVSHISLITRALGVDPGQFFAWAVPRQGPASPLIAAACGGRPPEDSMSDDEFSRPVKKALAEMLGLKPP